MARETTYSDTLNQVTRNEALQRAPGDAAIANLDAMPPLSATAAMALELTLALNTAGKRGSARKGAAHKPVEIDENSAATLLYPDRPAAPAKPDEAAAPAVPATTAAAAADDLPSPTANVGAGADSALSEGLRVERITEPLDLGFQEREFAPPTFAPPIEPVTPEQPQSAIPLSAFATDDVGPNQGPIRPGDITDDATPTINGGGQPGATIKIYDDKSPTPTVPIATTTVKPDGTWSVDTPTLPDGPHTITATQTDPNGNTGPSTPPLPFIVDTKAPDIGITLDANVAGDGVVNAAEAAAASVPVTGTVSGTFKTGDVVTVTLNGVEYKGPVAADGTFSIAVPGSALQADADRTIDASVTTTSAAGVSNTATDTVGYRLDTDPPLATIKLDANFTGDGIVNLAESKLAAVAVTGTVGGDVKVGDTVTVGINGKTFTTTVLAGNVFSVDVPGADLIADSDKTIDARVVTTDAAGNTATATTQLIFGVDITPPAKPTIESVIDDVGVAPNIGNIPRGGITDDTLPQIKGTAEPGSTVQVFDGTKLIGTTTAKPDGSWELTPDTPLLNGPRDLTAVASDPAGNPSVPSEPYPFTIDANGPVAPAITRLDDNVGPVQDPIQKNAATDDTTPTIVGTAGPNLKINVYDGTTLIGSTTSDAKGDWSLTPATPLAEGPHTVTATAVSAAGVESAPTGPYPFVIDTTAPIGTTLDGAADDVAPVIGDIPRGGTTNDATPAIRGTGEPGATITVIDNGRPIGTATVGTDGKWTLTPTTPLADGPHSVTATATDPAGNTSTPTPALPFIVDTSAVTDPVITSATDDIAPQTGVVASGGATNDTKPQLDGTAPAGSTVEVFAKSGAGAPVSLGTTTTDATGHWTLTPTTALAEGDYQFTARATNAAGTPSNVSAPYALTIDITAPAGPVITDVSDDVGSKQGTVAPGAATDDTTPTIHGTGGIGAKPGETINVYDGTTLIGTTTLGTDGKWALTPTSTLTDGVHTFSAKEVDAAGNVSVPSNNYGVLIDTVAPAKPTIESVIDDVGVAPNIGNIPRGGITDDTLPQIKGTAEPGSTVQVFDGTKLIGTTTAKPDGSWELTPDTPLLNGPRDLTAVASDPAGNPSVPSEPYPFTIDANGPVAPAITRLDDNVGPVQDPIQKNAATDDTTPTIVGTAGPNLKINVYDGTTLIGSTTSDAKGDWSLTPATPLAEGPHTVTATAVSAAGVESAPTGPYPFVIDTTAPIGTTLDGAADDVAPVIGDIPRGGTTNDATPAIRGTGEPGATITVIDNGRPIGTATVGTDGKWTLTPTTPLADGPHSVTATATDPAGNTSTPTPALPFIVDTSAVTDPVITSATDDIAPQTGVVASGGATNDTKPQLDGTAPAGSTVEVFAKSGAGAPVSLGTTTTDATGHWTLTPTTALAEGDYQFTARATNAAGTPSNVSAPYALTIDITAPAGPVITDVSDDVGSKQGTVAPGAATDDTTPTIHGTGGIGAKPGETINVYDGTTLIGTTTLGTDGKWALTPTSTLTDGVHTFSAKEVDAAGNVSVPSNNYGVLIDTVAPAKPVITGVDDDVGAIKGNVPNNGRTDDTQPGIRGTAEAGATVTVYEGSKVIGTALANGNGDWVLAVAAALATGAHTFTAVAADAATNASGPSNPYTITVDTTLVVVVDAGSATTASEEGLPGGNRDSTGSPTDTTDSTSAAGSLSVTGPGGAATTWTLTAPTTVITANGAAVTWTGSGTQTLVGSANGVQVATLSINNSGAYSFNLLAPIDHPVKNAEDVLTLNFGVNASNSTSAGSGTLAFQVEDDAPNPVAIQTRDAAVIDTNLLITLDISGSMSSGDGILGQTRLQTAIQSIDTLLDRYDGFGDVRVRLVTFSNHAEALGTQWTTVAEAKALLASLSAGGGTNYDEALSDAMSAFNSAGKLSGAQNIAYFVSDGAPTLGSGTSASLTPGGQNPPTNGSSADIGIQPAEEAQWLAFLNANQVKSFAIGIGAGAPAAGFLNPIAYDGQQQVDADSIIVTNLNQLDSTLATTAANIVTGNLLNGDLLTPGGGIGADAPGFVKSITVEGTTYTFNPGGGGSIAATGANHGTFDTSTETLTVTTAAGGRFIVDMDGGEYRYEAPTTVAGQIPQRFDYVLTDRDGDTVASSVLVNVSHLTTKVGTNAGETLDSTNAPDLLMGLGGNDTLLGNGGDDLLYGGFGNDRLFGGTGNDRLSGGADADLLNGGAGSDTLTGGGGADVFAWSLGDAGTATARPIDTITDFNPAPVNASGDVLDLRDLLVGELKGASTASNPNGTVGNLQNYLDFNVAGGNTEIRVSSTGHFAGGTYAAGSEDQRIVLQGVDIRSSLSLAANANDAQIIQELLNRGKLISD